MAANDQVSDSPNLEPRPPEPVNDLDAVPEVLRAEEEAPFVLPAEEEIPSVLPAPPHPGFWWAVLWCIAFLIVTQVFSGLLALLFVSVAEIVRVGPNEFLNSLKTQDSGAVVMEKFVPPAIVLSQIFVIGFSLLILRLVVGRDWTRQIALRRPAVKHVILALLGMPALSVVGGGVGELAKHALPGLGDLGGFDVESMIRSMRSLPLAFLILTIGVGPGLGEELWFRGFLGRGLVGRYGIVAGVILTSIFFGALHVDPPQALGAAVLGIGLHLTYLATRSLWVPMLLHFLNNSLAVVALTQPASVLDSFNQSPENTPAWVVACLYQAAFALLAAIGWAFYQSRARVVPETDPAAAWQPAYPGVEWPPRDSGSVVVTRWPSAPALILVAITFATFMLFLNWGVWKP